MSHFRLRLTVAVLALAALVGAGNALAAGNVVISQVYGGGAATTGSPSYKDDYVELFNRGTAAVELAGLSIQYASASGAGNFGGMSSQLTPLGGTIKPGQYFLVRGAGGSLGAALPTPDLEDPTPLNLAAAAGKVALVQGTTTLGCNGSIAQPCSPAQHARIIDLVGYGNANFYEGTGAAPTLNSTTAAMRLNGGYKDTDDNAVDFVAAAPTPRSSAVDPAPQPYGSCFDGTETRIHAIQGATGVAAIVGVRTIEGVVVADFQELGELGGFYVQEEETDQDTSPATSEGIFVSSVSPVAVGDIVRVRGRAGDAGGLTEISAPTEVEVCGTGGDATPTALRLPVEDPMDHERVEGMLVAYEQTLTVTEVYTLGRFGEVVLSGSGRLYIPTAVAAPRTEAAAAVAAANARSRIVLDDGNGQSNIFPTRYPTGGLSAANTLRVGDTVAGVTGVMDYRFSAYRVQPTTQPVFHVTNPRPAKPTAVGGTLRVASFNVLNYFNGDGSGGGFPTPRGATTPEELERQEAKLVRALAGIDGDIVGLMEIENDAGPTSALAQLTARLNAAIGAGTYAAVDTGVIGTDEIKVALIYKPGVVELVGDWKLLTADVDPRFDTRRNRPALAQTFRFLGSSERLTVIVNHLKSKGSGCGAGDDATDGSGNCDGTRTRAAAALNDWVKSDPTASGDSDHMIIGDLNAYTFERPITTLTNGGFVNLIEAHNELTAYSYVFGGESGYLDHALATPTLAAAVTGVTEWHINADEPEALNYDDGFEIHPGQAAAFYAPDPYRASDHDPVIVGVAVRPTYGGICELIRSVAVSRGLATSLCAKLDAAAAADARGNGAAKAGQLSAFEHEVAAQTGKALTAAQAATLRRLVRLL